MEFYTVFIQSEGKIGVNRLTVVSCDRSCAVYVPAFWERGTTWSPVTTSWMLNGSK